MSEILNWKSITALCLGIASIIFASKMNSNQAEEVSMHAIDACKEIFTHKVEG